MSRVVHFEIPAENPQTLTEFYRAVFGWAIQKWDGPMDYWTAKTGPSGTPGIDGAFLRKPHARATLVNTIEVTSVDRAIEQVVGGGGKHMVPKVPIPGVGWVAYCADPEGNMFGLLQRT